MREPRVPLRSRRPTQAMTSAPARAYRRSGTAAFTLIELMIVVFIIGVLAAFAIPAFSQYVRRSRTAEVANTMNKMWQSSVAYFTAGKTDINGLPITPQFPGGGGPGPAPVEPNCCLDPTQRCPGNDPVYSTPIWQALALNLPNPHYYRPAYRAAGQSVAATFTAEVFGDLDCDGVFAYFSRSGFVDSTAGDVVSGGTPFAVNDTE